MKKYKIFLIALVISVFVVGGVYILWNNFSYNNEAEKKEKQLEQKAENQFGQKVDELLQKNNIDLSYLRSIKIDSYQKTSFFYDEKPTGYSFSLASRTTVEDDGTTRAWFNVFYKSLPVFTSQLGIHFYPSSKNLSTFSNNMNFVNITVSSSPSIFKSEARAIAISEQPTLKNAEPKLGYWDKNAGSGNNIENYALVWSVSNGGVIVVLDANSRAIIYSFDGIYTSSVN